MSKHGAYQDLLDGSFHCANLFQIKFIEGARMLSSSKGCINEADILFKSQPGVFTLNAPFAGGYMHKEVRGLMRI